MILSVIRENNYPFISGCDMDLGTGNKLENGVILNAKLYPRIDYMNYGYISYIGLNPKDKSQGLIIVRTDTGEELCQVLFPTTDAEIVTGIAYRGSRVCGSICATRNIIPVFKARYSPRSDSFIFAPSAILPRPASIPEYNIRTADGKIVSKIQFEGDVFETTPEGAVTIHTESLPEASEKGITKVNLVVSGGITTTTYTFSERRNINIRSDKGCGVRVVPEDSKIVIGAAKDV